MSVPYQKIVKIQPRIKRNANNRYAMFNLEALSEATKNLNGSGLKMWLYLNKNQDGFEVELSQAACSRDWGIKKDSYYNGIKELIIQGYLVPICEGSNIYYFYEKQKTEAIGKSQFFSETSTPSPEKQINTSDFPQRNNTNNTEIIQNNTRFPFRIDENKNNYFSYDNSEEQFDNNDDVDERFRGMSKEMAQRAKDLGF